MARPIPDPTVTTVRELMSTDLHTLTPEHSLADVRSLMNRHRIRHVPIVNDHGDLVGLVSQRDVLAASDSRLSEDPAQRDPAGIRLGDIMTRKLVTVNQDTSARRAALYMERHKYGCLPVMSGKRLVGIITDTDFVGLAINLLEQFEATEPGEEI
jgi:CBS domain-containing protein